MRLEALEIVNFKNIPESSLEFSEGVNCFVGSNGMGKSNLLEAVYYLAMIRSFLGLPDSEIIRHGATQMMVQGRFRNGDGPEAPKLEVSVGYVAGRRKGLRIDGKECKRFSDHIGTIPLVMVSPQDHMLVTGSPEERRRLLDLAISQADRTYLQHLIRFGENLKQRNAMLRQGIDDRLLMESLEAGMAETAAPIVATRAAWTERMREPFGRYYARISGQRETASMSYKPSYSPDEGLLPALERSRARDSLLGFTTVGPHRDDLEMTLDGYPLRRTGSQGQLKSFTVALRLALFEDLNKHTSSRPLLLLDDIFDKLDAPRVEAIVAAVSDTDAFGQIFITDTNRKHIDSILRTTAGSYRLFGVEEGHYKLLTKR